METVKRVLDAMNVPYTIANKTKSVENVIASVAKGRAVIVTSSKAKRDYDPHHPERIVCFVVKASPAHFFVVVNNRENDLEADVRFWWNRDVGVAFDGCNICMKKVKQVAVCHRCNGVMCVKCYDRVSQGTCYQCPTCRGWTLHGDGYGVPWRDGEVVSFDDEKRGKAVKAPDAFDKFGCVLSRLDGLVSVIIRVGNELFLDDGTFCTLKLSFTDRYADELPDADEIADGIRDIRDDLCDSGETAPFKMYVIRDTYAIDKEKDKPTQEISLFQVRDDELIQYPMDAWRDVLPQEERWCRKKVSYMTPHEFVMPPAFSALFGVINAGWKCVKTVSIGAMCDCGCDWCNFDIDTQGAITTMSVPMVASVLDNLVRCHDGVLVFVTCRLFSYEDVGMCDLVSYVLHDGKAFERMTPEDNRKLYETDADGLKGAKEIGKFHVSP